MNNDKLYVAWDKVYCLDLSDTIIKRAVVRINELYSSTFINKSIFKFNN